jgi:hypothetical protein
MASTDQGTNNPCFSILPDLAIFNPSRLCIMTLSTMTLSIKTLNTMTFSITILKCDTKNYGTGY